MSTKTQLLALAGVLVLFVGTIALHSLFGIWFWTAVSALVSLTIGLAVTFACFVFASMFILKAEEEYRKNPETTRKPHISLKHNPDTRWSVRLAVQVDENRAVAIEQSGNPIRIIHGGAHPRDTMYEKEWKRRIALPKGDPEYLDKATPVIIRLYDEDQPVRSPVLSELLFRLFRWYEIFIFNATKLYVYVPLFTEPNTKPLPRYEVKPKGGKNVYTVLEEGDKGYYTNHVRTALTTWYFEYDGVDIDGIPFEITGSVQYSIAKHMVREAIYKTDAWNVLLDQADFTVIRSTVKDQATIDKVLGKTTKDNWSAPRKSKNLFQELAEAVFKNLKGYEFDVTPSDEHPDGKLKLEDVGIIIHKVMFNDFEPKLEPEELLQLRAPALQQRVARGIESVGRATAANHAALIEVHKDGGETSDRILQADALVRATQNSGGNSAPSLGEALLASIAQGNMKGK